MRARRESLPVAISSAVFLASAIDRAGLGHCCFNISGGGSGEKDVIDRHYAETNAFSEEDVSWTIHRYIGLLMLRFLGQRKRREKFISSMF